MTALQDGKATLLSVMEVFVKEPLVDWERYDRRLVSQS